MGRFGDKSSARKLNGRHGAGERSQQRLGGD